MLRLDSLGSHRPMCSRNGVMNQAAPESMGFEKQAVQGASVRRIAEAMQGCEQRRNAPLIEAQRKGD
jgi:transketolase N-terminal domain/subunit